MATYEQIHDLIGSTTLTNTCVLITTSGTATHIELGDVAAAVRNDDGSSKL